MGRYKLLFQFFMVINFSLVVLYAADIASLIPAIETSWNSQKSSASTSRITFYESFFDCRKSKLSVEDVVEIVDGLELSRDEKVIEELVEKFNPEFFKEQQAHDQKKQKWSMWEKRTLISDGFRERSTGEDDEHVVARGLHLMQSRSNNEITCYEQGQCDYHYHQLDWFLAVPPEKVLQDVVSIEEGELTHTLRWKSGGWMNVDAESQLPIDEEIVSASGEILKKTFYRERSVYPGDVLIPAIRIEISFRESLARHVMVTVVEDARFNVDISESEFVLPAAANSTLADLRNNKRRGRRTKHDIEDSAEYFLAGALGSNAVVPAASRSFNWKAFFLILNGVVLIVLGVILWRRTS